MTDFLCPLDKGYIIQGDFNSKVFYGIRIEVDKCENTTENGNHCKSDDQINQLINSGYVEVSLVNSYFDFHDYENPIKKYLSTTNNLFMTNDGKTRWFEALLKQNEARTSDGMLYSEPFKSQKFYSISNEQFKEIPGEATGNVLAYITLGMARESDQYERTAYSFIAMFGFLGGLYSSLFFIGSVFVSLTQSKLFEFRLISHLYQLSDSPDSKPSDSDSFSNQKNVDFFISSEPSHRELSYRVPLHKEPLQQESEMEEEKQLDKGFEKSKLSYDRRFVIPKVSSLNNEDSLPEPEEERLSDKVIGDLSNELSNRRSVDYKWYDIYPDFR